MGRLTPSNTILAPSLRRDARAKRAKVTLTKDIPALLVAYPRARRGVEGSVLVVDPPLLSLVEKEEDRDGEREKGGGKERIVGKANEREGGKRGSGKRGKVGKKGCRTDADVDAELNQEREGKNRKRGGEVVTTSSKSVVAPTSKLNLESDEDDEGAKLISSDTTRPNDSDLPTPSATTATTTPKEPHSQPKIRIRVTDTLTAAHSLQQSLFTSTPHSHSQNPPRITILNMSSPLRPGGGFLSGATSQEESLCMRTTLYPSLREEFYRLPEVGGVYTRDVLVFREVDGGDSGAGGSGVRDLEKSARWWVDVVSAGMLRFTEVEEVDGEMMYVSSKDRELVEEKIRAVMRIVRSQGGKGVKGLVLGAWGCGAYGNPVNEVAGCWRRVLYGDGDNDGLGKARKWKGGKSAREIEELERERDSWRNIEIVFAIKERKMAIEFGKWFDEDVEVEMNNQDDEEEGSIEDRSEDTSSELQGKIAELEAQIAGSRSAVQKDMLRKMLATLKQGQEDDG